MKNNPLFLTGLALLVLFTSIAACHKSNSTENSTSSTITLVTQSPWVYDVAGIDFDKNGTIDDTDNTSLPACIKDNSYVFNKDSTGVMNEGATKCDVGDPQTLDFTWSVSGSNPQIIKSDANPLLVNGIGIYSISGTQFKLFKDTTVQGFHIYYILQLKH